MQSPQITADNFLLSLLSIFYYFLVIHDEVDSMHSFLFTSVYIQFLRSGFVLLRILLVGFLVGSYKIELVIKNIFICYKEINFNLTKLL